MKRIAILSLAALVSCSEVPRNYPTYADRLHVNTSLEHYRCAVSQEEGERQLVELAATSDVEEGFLCFPQGWMEVGALEADLSCGMPLICSGMPYHTHPMRKSLEFLAATKHVQLRQVRDLRRTVAAVALFHALPSNRDLGCAVIRGKKEVAVSPFGIVEYEPKAKRVDYKELTKVYYSIVNASRFTSCDETALPDCIAELNAKQQWILFNYRRLPACDKYFEMLR